VVVDLFTQNISKTTERVVNGLYTLGFAALGLAMSWRFYHAYEDALVTMETSQDLLLPMSDLYLVVCGATLMLGVRSLLVGGRDLMLGKLRLVGDASNECTAPQTDGSNMVLEGETP
jgi:hypothetical protein